MSEKPLEFVDDRVFLIRPVRQDDIEHLLWTGPRPTVQQFLDRQVRGEAVILVATLDDELVGRLAVDLDRLRDEGGVYLYWFGVREEFGRKGIGSALISRAEQDGLKDGRAFSEIEVEKTNEAARRLYERLGYGIIGESLNAWMADLPDGRQIEVIDDCWALRKSLFPPSP